MSAFSSFNVYLVSIVTVLHIQHWITRLYFIVFCCVNCNSWPALMVKRRSWQPGIVYLPSLYSLLFV